MTAIARVCHRTGGKAIAAAAPDPAIGFDGRGAARGRERDAPMLERGAGTSA